MDVGLPRSALPCIRAHPSSPIASVQPPVRYMRFVARSAVCIEFVTRRTKCRDYLFGRSVIGAMYRSLGPTPFIIVILILLLPQFLFLLAYFLRWLAKFIVRKLSAQTEQCLHIVVVPISLRFACSCLHHMLFGSQRWFKGLPPEQAPKSVDDVRAAR